MWKKTCRGPPPYLAIYHNGLFQKKSKQGTGGGESGGGRLKTYFFENPPKTLFISRNFAKLCYPTEILKPKTKTLDIPHYFFLVTHGNSTLLLISPWKIGKSTCYFFNESGNSISSTPCLFFFWNSPIQMYESS